MFKIINMNARLYDPVIGLFFSPDPVIQDFENTQCLNRYSYCRNNPVMNWDLDGKIASPIFDSDGNYLGTDNKGYNGEILIFEDPSKFKQGMDHDEAKTLGKEFSKSELSIVEKSLVLNHVINGTILPYGEGKLTNKNSFIAEVENIILGNRRIEANAAYIGYANKRHMMLADFGDFEYTVENIRGEATHEIWGHGIKKYGDDNQTHWKIYAAQIDSPNWNNSTPRYKKHVALTLYLYYNNEVKNRNLPEKYLKIVREYYNK